MLTITLTNEQEKFLEDQLKKGKYKTPQEVVSKAFEVFLQQEKLETQLEIQGGESAQKLLAQKLEQWRKEREVNQYESVDSQREKVAQELRDLFDKTQAIPDIQNITDEEIKSEIDAYRRGE
jgi:Arc/MetJ-type ribon-helix-helix transcriptional regulator